MFEAVAGPVTSTRKFQLLSGLSFARTSESAMEFFRVGRRKALVYLFRIM